MSATARRDLQWPSLPGAQGAGRRVRRWAARCAVAEGVGMAASAAAAVAAAALARDPGGAVGAWGVIVAGGLVEGVALGMAQATAFGSDAPVVSRRRWLLVTVVVAGIGWAVASAPAVLAGDDGGQAVPAPLILIGAAALGLGMGVVLGGAQAWVLRRAVELPWRWVGISAAAWTPAMVVIFVGATWTPAGAPVLAVVGLGALTGMAAGAVVGVVCGGLVPLLHGDRRSDIPTRQGAEP